MIPVELAARLRDAGLEWAPGPGDRFVVVDRGMDEDVFVISTMTVDVHELPARTVIGFNGTVEWALDDVDVEAALWLPRESQLRELLGPAFVRLERVDPPTGGTGGAEYRVVATIWAEAVTFPDRDPEAAYGRALLHLLTGGPHRPGG
ncbi:MAG TPA: hypothetical protein VF109_09800 [Mycobacteriales bacterium]